MDANYTYSLIIRMTKNVEFFVENVAERCSKMISVKDHKHQATSVFHIAPTKMMVHYMCFMH